MYSLEGDLIFVVVCLGFFVCLVMGLYAPEAESPGEKEMHYSLKLEVFL